MVTTDPNAPNVALFDIAEALTGRGYPEVEVHFFIDEASAISLGRAEKQLTQLALLGKTEEHDALEKTVEDLKASLRSQRYTYHLRGIPNKIRQDALAKAFEKYPRKRNALGIEEEDDERDNYYTTLLWQAMTVKIVAPTGAVQVNPPLETIQQIRDFAPVAALDQISQGIQELSNGVRSGFEAAAQDTDFLSKP